MDYLIVIICVAALLWKTFDLINAFVDWRRRRAADPLRGYRRMLAGMRQQQSERLETALKQRHTPGRLPLFVPLVLSVLWVTAAPAQLPYIPSMPHPSNFTVPDLIHPIGLNFATNDIPKGLYPCRLEYTTNSHWLITTTEQQAGGRCLVQNCQADHSEQRTEQEQIHRITEAVVVYEGRTNRMVLKSELLHVEQPRTRVLRSGFDYIRQKPLQTLLFSPSVPTNINFKFN